MSAYAEATAVTPGSRPGFFTATISDRWSIGSRPNGGYLLGLAGRALQQTLPHEHPLTVTGHYLSPPEPGPATVEVETVRTGRSVSTGSARLLQPVGEDGAAKERLRVLATFGTLVPPEVDSAGPLYLDLAAPELPPVQECLSAEVPLPSGETPTLMHSVDLRLDPATAGWALGRPSGQARMRGWLRPADGSDPDPLFLLLAVDALPPTVFELGLTGWAPTVELTVHVRARPVPGWLRVAVSTRHVASGQFEEDAEVWDAAGRLVAQSRQLARVAPVVAPG